MADLVDRHIIIAFAFFKGILIASTTAALDIAFWKSVIIALVSGTIGAAGAIAAAIIATRAAKENRELLRETGRDVADLKHKIGASNRRDDAPAESEPTDQAA